MKKLAKRVAVIFMSAVLLAITILNPVAFAASEVYELAFDNLFVFEQWANHAKSGVVSPGLTGGELTKDISAGSFTLTNNSTDSEIYTAHSMGSNAGYYSIPVKPNTSYIFEYVANGTVTSFESYVFYFDSLDTYISLDSKFASQYGHNMWSFTTPENACFIQIRFDNNSVGSYATVSDIRICESEVYEYTKENVFRKTYNYSVGTVYGELPEPERESLVFAGWFTGPDGTGERITADTAVAANSFCLYSKWEPLVVGDLEIVSLPVQQEYCLGEKLNTSGLAISVTYPDGTTKVLESGFYYSPQVLNETGTQTITITYGDKSVDFTVNVKEYENTAVVLNGNTLTVPVANHKYTFGETVSSFNRYEVHYSSDAYVKGIMLMGETREEFFLEPSEDGVFSGYIDGFLDGVTQTQVTSISFTGLDKDFMSFTLKSVDTSAADVPSNMVYLSSSDYKIGIDLAWGGALTYLEDLTNGVMSSVSKYGSSKITEVDFSSKVNSGWLYNTSSNVNLINCNDTGRLVQQSYYGTGSYPYECGEYNGVPWNYNPVQGGNVHNEPSKIVDLQVTSDQIYVKCRPLDWGKTAEHITPSYMEAWYTLEDGLMRATCRFVDYSGYPEATTTQELPAFYCVEPLNTFVYYSGGEAWTDSNTKVTESALKFWGDYPDQFFNCNENWAAFIGDEADSFGIGLYCPGQTNMYSGVFNRDLCTTVSPATESPTSYIAAVDTFTFKSFNPFSYAYYITTGNVDTIRNNFKAIATDPADPCEVGYTNGYCNNCGKYQVPNLSTDKYDLDGDGTKDEVYEVSNAGEIQWFAEYVNAGNSTANAILSEDINLEEKAWTPIHNFNGIFDGNFKSITGFNCVSDGEYTGMFGGGNNSYGTIKNVYITDGYFEGTNYVGALTGYHAGEISNCYVDDTVTVVGNSNIGALVGYLAGDMYNCYAYADTLIGSYNGNYSTVENCYYLSETETEDGGKTEEQFASGEVAYLLQSSCTDMIWGQDSSQIGASPKFTSNELYRVVTIGETGNYSIANVGDTNGDETVDVTDYQALVNMALSDGHTQTETENYDNIVKYDLDGDGYMDGLDASFMALLINGLRTVDVYAVGDYNMNGVAFEQSDITAMLTAIETPETLTTYQKYICDINADGKITKEDSCLLIS